MLDTDCHGGALGGLGDDRTLPTDKGSEHNQLTVSATLPATLRPSRASIAASKLCHESRYQQRGMAATRATAAVPSR